MDWIKTEERLPEKDQRVLIYLRENIGLRMPFQRIRMVDLISDTPDYYQEPGEVGTALEWSLLDVSHWMPLPEPPLVETHDPA